MVLFERLDGCEMFLSSNGDFSIGVQLWPLAKEEEKGHATIFKTYN